MKCDCFIIIFYGEKTMDLFEYAKSKTLDRESPLASRLRPTTLDEVVGQQHIIGKNTLLYRAIKADKLTSVIFYGPPGTGKTTLAKVIANTTSAGLSAVTSFRMSKMSPVSLSPRRGLTASPWCGHNALPSIE